MVCSRRRKRLGFRTEMLATISPTAICSARSSTAVNRSASTTRRVSTRAFSPLDAIETTLILWPRQFPFGLVKNPVFARQQRQLVEATWPMAIRPFPATRPIFRLIHFSVPHLPFVFDRRATVRPTTPSHVAGRALCASTRVCGRPRGSADRANWLATEPRPTRRCVLADHGFRFGGRETDPLHIPFIVKRADQTVRRDVTTAERGETLLRQVGDGGVYGTRPPS